MKNGKGVDNTAHLASSGLNLSNQGSKTEKHYNDLVALSRVSAAISGLQDFDTILKIGLDNVLNIMNGTVGGIMLLDESGQTLSYRVHHGLSDKYAEEMHLKLGEGIAGKVPQNGRAR